MFPHSELLAKLVHLVLLGSVVFVVGLLLVFFVGAPLVARYTAKAQRRAGIRP